MPRFWQTEKGFWSLSLYSDIASAVRVEQLTCIAVASRNKYFLKCNRKIGGHLTERTLFPTLLLTSPVVQRALSYCRWERERPGVLHFKLSSGSWRSLPAAAEGPDCGWCWARPGCPTAAPAASGGAQDPPHWDLSEMLTQALIPTIPSSTN